MTQGRSLRKDLRNCAQQRKAHPEAETCRKHMKEFQPLKRLVSTGPGDWDRQICYYRAEGPFQLSAPALKQLGPWQGLGQRV